MRTPMEHVCVQVRLTHRVFLCAQVYRMPRNVKGIGRTGKKHKKPASRPCGWAARSRCHRVPASAGARYFRGRRHLPLLGPRRRSKLAKINTRRADRPPHPALRMPQPPRPPHARIPHLPAALHRPRAALHASLAPHPLSIALVCAGAQICPSTSTRAEGGEPRRRSGGGAARVGWRGARGPRVGRGGGVGARRGRLRGGRPSTMGQKGPPHTGSFFPQAL